MTKYENVADSIRGKIESGEYIEGQALPTEQMLREEYSVSRQTVRQALSLLVSEGIIDKRQGSGSYVRRITPHIPEVQRSIAVITTYISDYIFPSILREVEQVLSKNNCTPLLYATQNRVSEERKILHALFSISNLAGVLVEGTKTALPNPNLDLYQKLIDKGIPLVFMNSNYVELEDAIFVLDDNYNGGYYLVKYLYDKGHRKIAGIFKSDDVQGHQRYAGYAAALCDLGIDVDDDRLFWYNTKIKEHLTIGNYPFKQVLSIFNDATAVVCYNDEVASLLVRELPRQGIRIPHDIAVVSFDNSRYSYLSPISITSLSHGENNVGKIAAELLMKKLAGEECQSAVAPWELIEKESSR